MSDYRQIDIYLKGKRVASTTDCATCHEAVNWFKRRHGNRGKVTARFAHKHGAGEKHQQQGAAS